MKHYRTALALAIAVAGYLPAAPRANAADSRPNILFILSDDHRPDCIGALGNPNINTPVLDKLVGRGVSFSRAYVMGSMQGAGCAPSRCMIQTGRPLFHLPQASFRRGFKEFAAAMSGQTEGRDWVLLPRVMRAAGYDTFHMGKGGNECPPALECYEENVIRSDPKPEERITSSQAHADRTIEYLRGRKKDRPFFIYLAPPVPHDPRVAPKEFMDMYDPKRIPVPASFLPVHPFDNGEMIVRDEQLAPWPRTPEIIQRHLADYYGCITCLDYHLGRIFDCLHELGQLKNTVIIFAGDNGLSLGEHGLMGKQNLYEFGGMHVPLVIAGPGIKRGTSDAFVYLYDLLPTICQLAGVTVPAAVDGKSLLPLLAGKSPKLRDYLFTVYKDVQRSVRNDRWKIIRYPQVNRTQLFDLASDPHELNDLAGKPEQAGELKRMLALLEQAQKDYNDPYPLTVAAPKPAAWTPPKKGEKAPADAAPGKKAKATQPNVIIVLTDDQGYGDFSCHGNPVLKTPQMDRLHDESIRFTDFHVASMCTPTRGQLLSGRDCLANGAMNVSSGRTFLRKELPTMADIFAASGYRCGQFGKWHLGDNYPYRPMDRGFHEAIWYPSSHIGSAPDFWDNAYFDCTYNHNGRREKFSGYTTDVFFSEAIKWMRAAADAGKPFFCYLPTAAAHAPLLVPAKYRDLYKSQKPNVARFFGMIANIDENLARLDDFLRETGLRDNTLLIFMTDNGGTAGVSVFNSSMRGKKIDLWEGGHRVPCFVRWPAGKLRAAGDVAELTEVQDLLPTLMDLCGLQKPQGAQLDGVSLAKLLRGEQEHLPDRMLVTQFSRMQTPEPQKGDAAVMWQRWRLVQDKELYDLITDFGQKTNLLTQRPDVATKMRAHYQAWWNKVAAKVNEHSAITIGADAEDPSQLSPADWEDSFLDQGAQIRAGLRRNGIWNILVARPGTYEIELRRWGREVDAPLTASLPPHQHADGEFPAGVALPIAKARLKVADFDQSTATGATEKAVKFTAHLDAGQTKLQTWFYDADGAEICGAYYVYVHRKPESGG